MIHVHTQLSLPKSTPQKTELEIESNIYR
jgi:hypothetical protein